MAQSFSERMGFVEPKKELAFDEMPTRLRNRLFNVYSGIGDTDNKIYKIGLLIWTDFFVLKETDYPAKRFAYNYVTGSYSFRYMYKITEFISEWWECAIHYEIYDIMEFLLNNEQHDLDEKINSILEEEKSFYRLTNNNIFIPITNKTELQSANDVLNVSDKYAITREHFQKAVNHFSDRENTDYINTISESVKALESLFEILEPTKNGKFGITLATLLKKGVITTNQKEGFLKLYAYTNNESKVRHSNIDGIEPTFADAKYMLVTISAFINFIIEKSEKTDI